MVESSQTSGSSPEDALFDHATAKPVLKPELIAPTRVASALVAGEESGEPEPFDFDAFIAAKTGEAETSVSTVRH